MNASREDRSSTKREVGIEAQQADDRISMSRESKLNEERSKGLKHIDEQRRSKHIHEKKKSKLISEQRLRSKLNKEMRVIIEWIEEQQRNETFGMDRGFCDFVRVVVLGT
ncbi:hypothetical protein AAHE18_09G081000 [Arachis hypogaea]